MQNNQNDIYFAAREPKELANNLLQKSNTFYNYFGVNNYLNKVLDNWSYYYGNFAAGTSNDDHKIAMAGEQGELVYLPVNHFRNIAQHILNMITSNRPAMEARAINTDYKSLSQAYLANGILDYYMREKGLEDVLKSATEMAIVMGSGFIKMEWNATSGEIYDFDEENGQTDYSGELEFTTLSPLDVVYDGTKESFKQDWILARTWKNKYDLMAKYPEFRDKIEGLPVKNEMKFYRNTNWTNDDTDDIAVYEFFHKRTESLPQGRYMLFLSEEITPLDAPLPYRTLPIFRITPGNIMGTPYGYTPMFDIYPLQQAINMEFSTILTNHNAFGVQSMFVKHGSDLSIESLEGGMNVIKGNEPPVPVQFTSTPKEVFDFLQILISSVETISGVNSVTRGDPQASIKSGTAMALVQSMALQYISGFQQSYVRLIEEVGTQLINNLKDFAAAPRVAAIVGKNNRTLLQEFTGDDLSAVNRVVVDIGNPLSRTTAGRVQMAEQMLQMNLLKTPQQYFQVLNTGKLDTAFEGDFHQLLLIQQENEMMMAGELPIVSPMDLHDIHIKEHGNITSDAKLRSDPAFLRNFNDHIQKHLDALTYTDPRLLTIIGQQPLPPPMPAILPQPGAPAPQPGQATAGGAPQGGPSNMMQQQPAFPDKPEPINGQMLPQNATPPEPFEQLPTDPKQMIG